MCILIQRGEWRISGGVFNTSPHSCQWTPLGHFPSQTRFFPDFENGWGKIHKTQLRRVEFEDRIYNKWGRVISFSYTMKGLLLWNKIYLQLWYVLVTPGYFHGFLWTFFTLYSCCFFHFIGRGSQRWWKLLYKVEKHDQCFLIPNELFLTAVTHPPNRAKRMNCGYSPA